MGLTDSKFFSEFNTNAMMSASQIGSGISARVDDLHLSKSERLRAYAYMHDGELIAELLCRALASARSVTLLAAHGACSLAHAVKAIFVRPAGH